MQKAFIAICRRIGAFAYTTYLVKVFEEIRLEAHAIELLSKQLALDCLILVFADLVWVFQVNLVDKLADQILVKVRAKLFGKEGKLCLGRIGGLFGQEA